MISISRDSSIKASDLPYLAQPIIYGWWRPSLFVYLYIGQSKHGLQRLRTHDVVGKVEPFLPEDEIHFWKTSYNEMTTNERDLILFYQPKYNVNYTDHAPQAQPIKWPRLLGNPLQPGDLVYLHPLSQPHVVRQVFDVNDSYMLLCQGGSCLRLSQHIVERLAPHVRPNTWTLS